MHAEYKLKMKQKWRQQAAAILWTAWDEATIY